MTNETRPANDNLGEDYLVEQTRMRELLVQAHEVAKLPNVNMSFYIAMLKAAMKEADEAAISGDVVRMIRAYKAMREIES